MNKLEKMAKKKTGFRPDFGSFGSNLGPKNFFDVRHCCKLSLYAISRKTNEPRPDVGPNLVPKNVFRDF